MVKRFIYVLTILRIELRNVLENVENINISWKNWFVVIRLKIIFWDIWFTKHTNGWHFVIKLWLLVTVIELLDILYHQNRALQNNFDFLVLLIQIENISTIFPFLLIGHTNSSILCIIFYFQDQQPDERRILVPKESKNLFRVRISNPFSQMEKSCV